jgi:hypothetical protein
LREAIGEPPDDPDTPPVTVSIRVGVLAGADVAHLEYGLRLADAALYRAKSEGRNRVVLSPETQETDASARVTGGAGSISPDPTSR